MSEIPEADQDVTMVDLDVLAWRNSMLGAPNQTWGRWSGYSGQWRLTSDDFRRHWRLEGPR